MWGGGDSIGTAWRVPYPSSIGLLWTHITLTHFSLSAQTQTMYLGRNLETCEYSWSRCFDDSFHQPGI